jgi:hypothetical protein
MGTPATAARGAERVAALSARRRRRGRRRQRLHRRHVQQPHSQGWHDGRISTFAGNGLQTYTGEGTASQVALNTPYGVTVGPDSNVYIADTGNNRIRCVTAGCAPANCVISTVVGNGTWDFSGDNGPATSAALKDPYRRGL